MKSLKLLIVLLFLSVSSYAAMAEMFQSVEPKDAQIVQTGKDKMYCPSCGMNLPKFWKTSHAVKFKDGSYKQFCSIHCLVEEMEMTNLRDKKADITEILVADVTSNKYINAKKAFYVVGSSVKGTMTMTSKYAFAKDSDAAAFAAKNGGSLTDFDGAYKTTLTDFSKDIGLISKTRSTKMYKNGEMLYNNKCDKAKLDNTTAATRGELKAMIRDEKICGEDLNDGQLQAVMLYVWDVKLGKFKN